MSHAVGLGAFACQGAAVSLLGAIFGFSYARPEIVPQ
jgi:hypothetical protein